MAETPPLVAAVLDFNRRLRRQKIDLPAAFGAIADFIDSQQDIADWNGVNKPLLAKLRGGAQLQKNELYFPDMLKKIEDKATAPDDGDAKHRIGDAGARYM